MSNNRTVDTATAVRTHDDDRRTSRRHVDETKPSRKTTELLVYVLAVVGVLVASAVVDQNEDGQGFGAETAWWYVTLLTIGYMVARGLAKAGSYSRDDDPRN